MARLLLTVEDVLEVKDRELVLSPGIRFGPRESFRIGDPILLKQPGGLVVESEIAGLRVNAGNFRRNNVCLMLKGLNERDVPIGTEVWSVANQLLDDKAQLTCELPGRVAVHVSHARAEGLAIYLTFEMRQKNPFSYILFLGSDGTAEVARGELLRYFRQEWSLALMDYVDPETNFTGSLTARVLSAEEVRQAVKGFEMFQKYCAFPKGYEKNLRAAAARGQDPKEFRVELTMVS